MSLQDILMKRAALHFQNELEAPNPLVQLAQGVAVGMEEARQKAMEREERRKNFKDSLDQINQLPNSIKERMEIKTSYNMDKNGTLIPSISMSERKNAGVKGVYVVDPTTKKVTHAADVPEGSSVIQQPLSPEAIYDRTVAKNNASRIAEARKRNDEYIVKANKMFTALDNIEARAKELGDFKRGFVNQTVAGIGTMIARKAKDEKITRYEGTVAQELIPIARDLAEEKGPITEFDVARIEKGFGDITTPIEDKLFLINQLRDKVKKAIAIKKQESIDPGSSFDYLDEIDNVDSKVGGVGVGESGTALGIKFTREQ